MESLEELININFDGYALGGLAVGESQKQMFNTKSQMILSRRVLIENRIDLLICLGGNFSEI